MNKTIVLFALTVCGIFFLLSCNEKKETRSDTDLLPDTGQSDTVIPDDDTVIPDDADGEPDDIFPVTDDAPPVGDDTTLPDEDTVTDNDTSDGSDLSDDLVTDDTVPIDEDTIVPDEDSIMPDEDTLLSDPAPDADQDELTVCSADDVPLPNTGITEPAGIDGCPAGMTPIEGSTTVCIDRWEAFIVEVDGVTEVDRSPYFNPGSLTIRAKSAPGAIPQGYISQTQAAAACTNAGKRLCTDAEWLAACRGTANRVYPYGDTRQPGVCNDSRATHPITDYFGADATWGSEELSHSCIDQLPDTVDASGANTGCVSTSGAYDLMGNLHEWTADPAGTFRGGFFVDTVINGNGCLYVTTAHNTSYWDYSTGFRCCADR